MLFLPQPESSIDTPRATYRFYLGDCVEVFDRLAPASGVLREAVERTRAALNREV